MNNDFGHNWHWSSYKDKATDDTGEPGLLFQIAEWTGTMLIWRHFPGIGRKNHEDSWFAFRLVVNEAALMPRLAESLYRPRATAFLPPSLDWLQGRQRHNVKILSRYFTIEERRIVFLGLLVLLCQQARYVLVMIWRKLLCSWKESYGWRDWLVLKVFSFEHIDLTFLSHCSADIVLHRVCIETCKTFALIPCRWIVLKYFSIFVPGSMGPLESLIIPYTVISTSPALKLPNTVVLRTWIDFRDHRSWWLDNTWGLSQR